MLFIRLREYWIVLLFYSRNVCTEPKNIIFFSIHKAIIINFANLWWYINVYILYIKRNIFPPHSSATALRLDGNSEIGAHVKSLLCYLICVSHLIKSRAVTDFSLLKTIFLHACATRSWLPSNVNIMSWAFHGQDFISSDKN